MNRLKEGEEYGPILDYSGVIEALDQAIDFHGRLADCGQVDLEETVTCLANKADIQGINRVVDEWYQKRAHETVGL